MSPVRNKSPKALRIAAYVLFATLPVWLVGAGWTCYSSHRKLETWSEAEGQVVELVKRTSRGRHGRKSVSYSPRFEFTASNGENCTVTSSASSDPPEFAVGERMAVLYPEANPAEAVQKSFMGLWSLPLSLAVIGLGDALVACFFLWMARLREKTPAPVD